MEIVNYLRNLRVNYLLYFCSDEPSGRFRLVDKVSPGASILSCSFPIGYVQQLYVVLHQLKPSLFRTTRSSISNWICGKYFLSRHVLRLSQQLTCQSQTFSSDLLENVWILVQLFQLLVVPYSPLPVFANPTENYPKDFSRKLTKIFHRMHSSSMLQIHIRGPAGSVGDTI